MKKNFKTLTSFLLLLALIISITPSLSPFEVNTNSGISICTDDDIDSDVVRTE